MNTNIVTVQSLQWQELVNEIDVNKYPELVSYLEARNLLHRQAVLFKEEIKCA
jgi:hypothetical protein